MELHLSQARIYREVIKGLVMLPSTNSSLFLDFQCINSQTALISIIVTIKVYWTNNVTQTIGAAQKINGLWIGCVNAKVLLLHIRLLFMLKTVFALYRLDLL